MTTALSSRISSCVEACKSLLMDDLTNCKEKKMKVKTADVCSSHWGNQLDYPYQTSVTSITIVKDWEKMLTEVVFEKSDEECSVQLCPSKMKSTEGESSIPENVFVDMLVQCCSAIKDHIILVSKAFIDLKSLHSLYVAISTASTIRNRLWVYCHLLCPPNCR